MLHYHLPQRIVCLTEESVELLFAIGEQKRIVGVSSYVKRPKEAQQIKKVSLFESAKIQEIVELKPDLVLGYSDIQKDIARDLIEKGLNVHISNHRSLSEVLGYCQLLGQMVGKAEETKRYLNKLVQKAERIRQKALKRGRRFSVYLEEWDNPMITGIQYFSEIVELCGGDNIFKELSTGTLGKDRIVTWDQVEERNPDIIFACWCGKKVKIKSFYERGESSLQISALKNHHIFELEPEVFLQPGVALFESGLDIITDIFDQL